VAVVYTHLLLFVTVQFAHWCYLRDLELILVERLRLTIVTFISHMLMLFDTQRSNHQKVRDLVVIYTELSLFAEAQLCKTFG
jgi:hypothetical protein